MIKSLDEAAREVKAAPNGQAKSTVLSRHMGELDHQLKTNPTLIPLSASSMARGVDGRNCSYFNSNAFPLKLVLNSAEEDGGFIKAIYKVGDDLRQDMLTLQVRALSPTCVLDLLLQMIRVIDRLWLKAALDLRMVSFR